MEIKKKYSLGYESSENGIHWERDDTKRKPQLGGIVRRNVTAMYLLTMATAIWYTVATSMGRTASDLPDY